AEALERADRVRTPTHLRVWINKKYPEILATCFDGTAFGTQEASDGDEGPSVQTHHSAPLEDQRASEPTSYADLDDDIPF
ncbi:hypothetical protein, partial [Mycobacterium paragordonae]